MRLIAAAGVIASIEVLLTIAMTLSLKAVARRRARTGSTEPVTLGSSIFAIAWFLWHLPTLPWIGPSQRLSDRTKWLLIYAGNPIIYFAFFVLREYGIIGKHRG
jgi:hypothetical protein